LGNVAHSSVGERGIGLRRKQFLVREKRLLIMEERTREREREREKMRMWKVHAGLGWRRVKCPVDA